MTDNVLFSAVSPCSLKPCGPNGYCIDSESGYSIRLKALQYFCICKPPFMGPGCLGKLTVVYDSSYLYTFGSVIAANLTSTGYANRWYLLNIVTFIWNEMKFNDIWNSIEVVHFFSIFKITFAIIVRQTGIVSTKLNAFVMKVLWEMVFLVQVSFCVYLHHPLSHSHDLKNGVRCDERCGLSKPFHQFINLLNIFF